jgi:hypothetical protein
LAIDPSIGNIRQLDFFVDGRELTPLHTAPWADDPDLDVDHSVPLVEAKLAGDFFCAPFSTSDVETSPPHGWSANSKWALIDSVDGSLHLRLDRRVMGAGITKTLTLAKDAPLLYQTHVIEGGEGRISVAHHPMIRVETRARLSVSEKRAALSPAHALEAGRNRLACGKRVENISRFPSEDGGVVDLCDLPIGDRHEDFVTLIEAEGSPLGWTAVLRDAENDIVFVLKAPDILPVTMFWHSNGGRDHAPWNGQHRGVLGIEDGCAAGVDGHRASLAHNAVSDEGVLTALALGGTIRIPHVIGAIPRPQGWGNITAIGAYDGQLTLTDVGGESLSLPFDTEFLTKDH